MIKSLKEKTGAKIIVACSENNFDIFQGQDFIDKTVLFNYNFLDFKNFFGKFKTLRSEKADISIDTGQTANISAIMSYLTGKCTIGFSKPGNKLRNKVYDSLVGIDFNRHMIFNYVEMLNFLESPDLTELELVKLTYQRKDLEKVRKLIGENKKLIVIHSFHSIS